METKEVLQGKGRKTSEWFTELLDNVELSTTQFITHNLPDVKFVLLDQKNSDKDVFREIAFYSGNTLVCRATNNVRRNDVVNAWIISSSNEPFGKVFLNKNTKRTLISKTDTSRKYIISGDIEAEIEENFYPLP